MNTVNWYIITIIWEFVDTFSEDFAAWIASLLVVSLFTWNFSSFLTISLQFVTHIVNINKRKVIMISFIIGDL